MTKRPDFSQKLLNDLRQRKQRIATTQESRNTSSVPADAYGSSRQVLKGSRETKRLQTVGPKIGSKYKNSSTGHNEANTNQIIPYEGNHHVRERGDLAMALQYAFDNEGKLKRIDFTSRGKMIDFLQQIGRRSMQKSSTNQFPTLNHFHIDEIARGAQNLNQILQASSNGLNIDNCTVEIGKELWKGAIELEHSLKMLISLQEASERTVSSKRKSKVTLLEEGEDGKEETKSSPQTQKKIERPVFSFDKASKNKGAAQTSMQPNLMALTYLKEEPDREPKKQEYISPKGTSHRRSSSCGLEMATFQHTSFSIQKRDTGIPNIIAKLMGLEELSQKVNPKVDTERGTSSDQKLIEMEYANKVKRNQSIEESNKIALLKHHEPMWNEEKEAVRYNFKEPKATLLKINELQSNIMRGKQNSSIQKDARQDTRLSTTERKQEKVNNDMKTFPRKVPERNQFSDAVQAERLANLNDRTEKRATDNSVLKRIEVKSKQLDDSQNIASHVTRLQSQPLTKNLIPVKENKAKAKGLIGSKVLSGRAQTKEPTNDGKVTDPHLKQRSSVSLKSEQKSTSAERLPGPNKAEVQTFPNTDVKHPCVPHKQVIDELKPQKMGTTRTNEVITRSAKNAKKAARILKTRISNPEELQKRDSKFKSAYVTHDNVKLIDLESQLVHDLQSHREAAELSPNENVQNTKPSKDTEDQNKQELIPDEVQEVKPQSAVTDIRTGSTDVSYILQPNQQQTHPQIEMPEPLTQDEVYLKQKLITSHLFLNTADALFKLNIPIGTLNYAIDQMCHDKEGRLILDCGYEVLKRKGRRKEIFLHPYVHKFAGCKDVRSLDDLVRQLHKDFESLRSYGRNGMDEHDFAEHILRMLERDIHHREPDINCMWDIGWNEVMFSHVEMDEVITEMEHKILDELVNEIAKDCCSKTRDTENCNH